MSVCSLVPHMERVERWCASLDETSGAELAAAGAAMCTQAGKLRLLEEDYWRR